MDLIFQHTGIWVTALVLLCVTLIAIVIIAAKSGSKFKDIHFDIKKLTWKMGFFNGAKESTRKPPEAATAKNEIQPLTDVAQFAKEAKRMIKQEKKGTPASKLEEEKELLAKGFKFLEQGLTDLRMARKCFIDVQQINPKSSGAYYGLGRASEIWGNRPTAHKFYWNAAKAEIKDEYSAKAEQMLEKINIQQGLAKDAEAARQNGKGINCFWFKEIPGTELLLAIS